MSDRHAARRSTGPAPDPIDQPVPTVPVGRIGNSEEQAQLLQMLGLPGETSGARISELLRELRTLPDHARAAAIDASGIAERLGPTRLSVDSLKALLLRLATATNVNLMIRQLSGED